MRIIWHANTRLIVNRGTKYPVETCLLINYLQVKAIIFPVFTVFFSIFTA